MTTRKGATEEMKWNNLEVQIEYSTQIKKPKLEKSFQSLCSCSDMQESASLLNTYMASTKNRLLQKVK